MINCKFENGQDANLRHVVVDAIVLNPVQDAVLLVKRAPHLSNGNKYGLVGGFLDRNETLDDGILRELKEETGYDGTVLSYFDIIDNPDRPGEDRQNVSFIFIVQAGAQTGTPDNESLEVKWFRLNDLPIPEEFAFDHYDILSRFVRARQSTGI